MAVLAALLSACAVGPNYRTPRVPLPRAFDAAPAASGGGPSTPAAARPAAVDPASWWRSLGDPLLDSLVERAVRSNLDLEVALDRLQEARMREAVVLGGALPEVGVSAGGGLGTGRNATRGRTGPGLNAATNPRSLSRVDWAAGFDAVWELDVFGKYRREIEASRYDTEAAIEARGAVLVTVVADVVRAYLDMRGLQIELSVARQAVEADRRSRDLVRSRYLGGFTNALDLALAERELAAAQARVAPLAARVSAAQDTVALLLGTYPEEVRKELETPRALPPIPPDVQPGLPIDLLRRRPDIRQAERQLAAATARIGVATADLFPRISVNAAVGLQHPAPAEGGQGIWSAGPFGMWNLLDFGQLDALVSIADLRTRAQFAEYRATILRAVGEVDTAATAYQAQRDRLRNLEDALAASHEAVRLANQRYDRGLTDYLNVLDAERQEFDLEDQYGVAQAATADQFVALYKALGGGWEGYQAIPPIRRPRPAVIAAFARLFSTDDPQK